MGALSPLPMLGVFDSGLGGRHALAVLRTCLPTADIVFLADTAHAPYGTKAQPVLCELVREDIRRLRAAGADKILCACCTASCVLPYLSPDERSRVYPILTPTAKAAARRTQCHRYVLLATEATVREGAFVRALTKEDPTAHVLCRAAQPLVTLAEQARTDMSDAGVYDALMPHIEAVRWARADTLVLGCTHFASFTAALSAHLPDVHVISSAEEGARAFVASLPSKQRDGHGYTVYL